MYVCLKACALGGTQYGRGDSIPAEAVLPARARALRRMGYLAEAEEPAAPPPPAQEEKGETPVLLPVVRGGGLIDVPALPEDIRAVFGILQQNAEDAVKALAAVEREETLVLLHAADGRKTVKTAVEARAKALGFAGDAL